MPCVIYIYVLIDPTTNQIRYVGKTNNLRKRYNAHLNSAKERRNYTQRWLHKLLRKGQRPKMRIVDFADETTWVQKEQHWISVLRSQGASLTNTTEGGEGMHGYSPTPATLAKRSNTVKGRRLSAEARANQSRGRMGMKFSPEHREHLRQRKRRLYDSERGKQIANQFSRAYGVLTDEQVIEVWKLAREGKIPQWKIGEMYGIPGSSVSEIKHNKRYKHVKRPE